MLRTTEAQLGELPREPSKDPVGEVYAVISKLTGALNRYVEGTPNSNGLLQTIRPKQQAFKEAVRNTAPDFRPFERSDANGPAATGLTLPEFLSNEETPRLPEDEGNAIYVDEVMELALQLVPFVCCRDCIWTLIMSVRAVTRELPDNIPFVVTEALIHDAIDLWQAPAVQLFDYVEEILNVKVAEFVHIECRQYPQLEFLIS